MVNVGQIYFFILIAINNKLDKYLTFVLYLNFLQEKVTESKKAKKEENGTTPEDDEEVDDEDEELEGEDEDFDLPYGEEEYEDGDQEGKCPLLNKTKHVAA